jgi:GNAT superfamily N-acetyltransferase
MVHLEAMGEEHYQAWRKKSVSEYAHEMTKAGNVSAENALDIAEQEYQKRLPHGLSTKEQYLYNIMDSDTGQCVGTLWFETRNNHQEVFVLDIRINEEYRGKGYGKQTMNVLEGLVKEMGIPKISLHVFSQSICTLRRALRLQIC